MNINSASAPPRGPVARRLRTMVAVPAGTAVLLGIAAVPAPAAADLDRPVVEWADFPPLVRAGESVTATWRITDATGVEAGQVRASLDRFDAPEMPPTRVSGTDQDAIYQATWALPSDYVGEGWLHLWGTDKVGNSIPIGDRGDGHTDFLVLESGSDDTVAPAVASLDMPRTVKPGESVTATWRITDATGVDDRSTGPMLSGPKPGWWIHQRTLERVSGTDQDAIYQATWAIPTDAVDGDFTVWIRGTDNVGNSIPWAPEGHATITVAGRSNDTEAPAAQPSVRVKVKPVNGRSKLYVNVNPNKGKGFWKFKVQKQRANGTWKTYKKTYKTRGKGETRKLNFKRGTYRVKVKPKYGYQGTASDAVWLRR